MRNNNSPCYKCERRTLGCHSQCEDYKVFDAENKADNLKRHDYYVKRATIDNLESDVRYKLAKRRWRKK